MDAVLSVFEYEMAKGKKISKAYKHLYNEILTYKFQAFTNFLLDILWPISTLQKNFNKKIYRSQNTIEVWI